MLGVVRGVEGSVAMLDEDRSKRGGRSARRFV
jgi:hypothetical protein